MMLLSLGVIDKTTSAGLGLKLKQDCAYSASAFRGAASYIAVAPKQKRALTILSNSDKDVRRACEKIFQLIRDKWYVKC